MLHVTNGDCAAGVLRKAGMTGDILPWRDVLHEGPLDPSLSLEELSKIRARFIADMGWAPYRQVLHDFNQRDQRLRRCAADEEVVLWFEPDLYDQLQLLQVLAWFHAHPHPRLTLVCEPEYLGEMQPRRAEELFHRRKSSLANSGKGRHAHGASCRTGGAIRSCLSSIRRWSAGRRSARRHRAPSS